MCVKKPLAKPMEIIRQKNQLKRLKKVKKCVETRKRESHSVAKPSFHAQT